MARWVLIEKNFCDCTNKECQGENTMDFYEKDEKKGITHKYVCTVCGQTDLKPQVIE